MTLILTFVRPGEGAWQTVDSRVTRGGKVIDDFAPKQLHVHGADGSMLLAYTGVAEIGRERIPTHAWLRQVISGQNMTIDGYVSKLFDRVNQDVYAPTKNPLHLVMVATVGTGIYSPTNEPPRPGEYFFYEITNIGIDTRKNQYVYMDRFDIDKADIPHPKGFPAGSGQYFISKADRAKLVQAAGQRPRRDTDYLGLLAGVNRRIASRLKTVNGPARNSVSPWCMGAFLPPEGAGLQVRTFVKPGETNGYTNKTTMPTILFGLDLGEAGGIYDRMQELLREQ